MCTQVTSEYQLAILDLRPTFHYIKSLFEFLMMLRSHGCFACWRCNSDCWKKHIIGWTSWFGWLIPHNMVYIWCLVPNRQHAFMYLAVLLVFKLMQLTLAYPYFIIFTEFVHFLGHELSAILPHRVPYITLQRQYFGTSISRLI